MSEASVHARALRMTHRPKAKGVVVPERSAVPGGRQPAALVSARRRSSFAAHSALPWYAIRQRLALAVPVRLRAMRYHELSALRLSADRVPCSPVSCRGIPIQAILLQNLLLPVCPSWPCDTQPVPLTFWAIALQQLHGLKHRAFGSGRTRAVRSMIHSAGLLLSTSPPEGAVPGAAASRKYSTAGCPADMKHTPLHQYRRSTQDQLSAG